MRRVGVLISGRGSNLQALINAERQGTLGGKLVLVISNQSNAFGLQRAKKAGIPTRVVSPKNYQSREEYDRKIIDCLRERQVDLVVLAGYMRILSKCMIDAFPMSIINIHPSLLPSFKGVDAQALAIKRGVRISGCTTHFVTEDVDSGPIILQKAVPVLASDDRDALADRILAEEHRIIVRSVQLYCEGRLSVKNGVVLIQE
jgi:phosphoribosylglycinamide formyltransferase-1